REAALIEMWTRRAELLVAHPLMLAVRHGHPALAVLETQIPAISETSLAQAGRALGLFERRLADCRFVGGERPTLADGVLFTGLEFARMVRFRLEETHPNLLRWQAELRARPSAEAGA
ncbi:MAG: glutathione S-transferase C-terminal domain-containing protein, partial [Alphaproteobacteria bacterium]|nr:glutathione S-transferase C-terminal domain-containing protein [Alphaproteobacteria bacterium]